MTIKELIRTKHIKNVQLQNLLGINQPNTSLKLSNDKFTLAEVVKVLEYADTTPEESLSILKHYAYDYVLNPKLKEIQ